MEVSFLNKNLLTKKLSASTKKIIVHDFSVFQFKTLLFTLEVCLAFCKLYHQHAQSLKSYVRISHRKRNHNQNKLLLRDNGQRHKNQQVQNAAHRWRLEYRSLCYGKIHNTQSVSQSQSQSEIELQPIHAIYQQSSGGITTFDNIARIFA